MMDIFVEYSEKRLLLMEIGVIEENICHELNKILHLCEIENKQINDNLYDERNRSSQSEDPKLKFYHYFNISTRMLMAMNLGINSERQLRRYYENPIKILDNFNLCNRMAEYQKISYIEMMSRILGEKILSISYKSAIIDSIYLAEEKISKTARRKLARLVLILLENKIDIDSFYDSSLFLIEKNHYNIDSINKIRHFLSR